MLIRNRSLNCCARPRVRFGVALGNLAFALFAGSLSVLSPCVLPILPVVFGTAAAQHRLAPAALGAGIVLSFSAVGLFIATAGFSMGLDGGVFRDLGAAVLVGLGRFCCPAHY